MELLTFDNLAPVLEDYARELRAAYQDRLIADGKIASGDLLNSIEYRVEAQDNIWRVYFDLAGYWRYVEYGRRPGKFPPPSAILSWIAVKPVIPKPDDKGRVPTPKQLAYLIGRKIATEGIEAGGQLAGAKEGLAAKYVPLLREALAKDMAAYVSAIIFDMATTAAR